MTGNRITWILALLFVVGLQVATRGIAFDAHAELPQTNEPLVLVKAAPTAAIALNYTTAASDLLWIASVVSRGEDIRQGRTNNMIIANGMELSTLDPKFRRLYEWFPAVSLSMFHPITHDRLMEIADLYAIGIDAMPVDTQLRYDAGILFIGYSSKHKPKDRRKQYDRAIEFLEPALNAGNAPPMAFPMYQFFKKGIRSADGGEIPENDREVQIDLLAQLFMAAETAEQKASYINELQKLGANESATITRAQKYSEQQQALLERTLPYSEISFLAAVNP